MSSTVAGRAHLVRAAVVLTLATAGVAGLSRIASSAADAGASDRQPPPTLVEGQPVSDPPGFPDEPATLAPDRFSVPASAPIPAGASCPAGWSWFENPSMHYGLCVPPGWGFTDFSAPDPLEQIPSVQLEGLHLVSASAFPWRPGARPFDAIRNRGIVDVELMLLEPGMAARGECEPAAPRPVADLTFLTCEQRYDALGLPAPTGTLRATKIAVPLTTTPAQSPGGPDLTGARLLVIARTSPVTPLGEVRTLWQLVDSIRPL